MMKRFFMGLASLVVLTTLSGVAIGQDVQSNAQVEAAISDQLAPYALRRNNLYYTQFEVGGSQPQQRQGDFVQPLTPRGAPMVRNGIMEITPFYPLSISLFPDRNGGRSGVASLRLFRYRIFQPGRGWGAPVLMTIHFWEWKVQVDTNGVRVVPKMDQTAFPTDNGPRELVASVFNVPPQGVSVASPRPDVVEQVLAQGDGGPSSPRPNGGCRPCETQQANGRCVQWRACF